MYLSTDFIANESVNPVAESLLCQLNDVPKAMDSALKSERLMKDLVNETQDTVDRFIFVGSGPNVATALEAALKMKETSYAAAEGFGLEQFLHGPWVSLDRSQMVLLIAPKGPSYQRYFDLLSVCNRLKVPSVAITDDKHIKELASHCVWMEDISEELSPLTYIIPLQLFAYQSTLAKRINPDYIHYDDPDIWEARQIVFPPGTH
jgi:glucosamine--fructose-6-phosphate aminotransferase (isomerizing)